MRVHLQGISKRFGKVPALESVSLTIEPGQIVSLVGPNGAGKTTLLRCLASIVAPSAGGVYFDDAKLDRGRMDLRRKIAFLPDSPVWFANHRVLRHLAMVLRLYGRDDGLAAERAMELLREFDLLPLIDTQMAQLSRGQAYKAALIALLAADPELLLLDEPFASGMDPNGIAALKREARQMASRGRTIVYSTQILDIAEKLSDWVCVIDRGQVRHYAPLQELGQALSGQGEGSVLEKLFQELRESAQ
jgi:ABC-type multidrug transport system ATPase subunit